VRLVKGKAVGVREKAESMQGRRPSPREEEGREP